jgi:hypothetical protein
MKTQGNQIIMQSAEDALKIWREPTLHSFPSGGYYSLRFAVWENYGIELDKNSVAPGFSLVGKTPDIERYYNKLCSTAARPFHFTIDLETRKHNYPEDCVFLDIVFAYHQNPELYHLDYLSTDWMIAMVITNKQTQKWFRLVTMTMKLACITIFIVFTASKTGGFREKGHNKQ